MDIIIVEIIAICLHICRLTYFTKTLFFEPLLGCFFSLFYHVSLLYTNTFTHVKSWNRVLLYATFEKP